MRREGTGTQILPEVPLIALELVERGGEPARIARELGTLEVGVVLARARQAELQQAADGGREVEQQQRRQEMSESPSSHAGRLKIARMTAR